MTELEYEEQRQMLIQRVMMAEYTLKQIAEGACPSIEIARDKARSTIQRCQAELARYIKANPPKPHVIETLQSQRSARAWRDADPQAD